MIKTQLSTKRTMIDKTNSRIVAYAAVAAFMVVFALVASKTLISEASYQNKVINAKRTAVNQLKTDIQQTSNLSSAYQAFVNTPQNVLGGNPNSNTGPQDGDNAKVVLDALPSQYDWPALLTSLDFFLKSKNVQIQSVGGTDEEVAQTANQSSGDPKTVSMPFQISVNGNYRQIQALINEFNVSIRPFQIETMQLSGDQANMTLTLSAQTFYQPSKKFTVSTETIQ
jgi:Tfp pilus assembly protein PilO